MDALNRYQFCVIRYVPDIVREEFVNVGVLVVDSGSTLPPLVRLTRDWARLRSLDPDVDIEMLQSLEEGLTSLVEDSQNTASIQNVQECFSHNVQLSPFKARAAESMESLAASLMTLYVLPPATRSLIAMATG